MYNEPTTNDNNKLAIAKINKRIINNKSYKKRKIETDMSNKRVRDQLEILTNGYSFHIEDQLVQRPTLLEEAVQFIKTARPTQHLSIGILFRVKFSPETIPVSENNIPIIQGEYYGYIEKINRLKFDADNLVSELATCTQSTFAEKISFFEKNLKLLHMQQAICPVVNAERFAEDFALSTILKEVLCVATIPLPPMSITATATAPTTPAITVPATATSASTSWFGR